MRKIIKDAIRKYCPDVPAIRWQFNRIKLKEINRYLMSDEDILFGEKSIENQIAIVKIYSEKWPQYAERLNNKFDEYVLRCCEIKERQDLDILHYKTLFACFAYGFLPDEFFVYELEDKSIRERRSYISDRDCANYAYRLNDIIHVDMFFDKFKTYQKYKKYYMREAICIDKKSDYSKFCDFLERYPVFVRKNVALSKGDSVELVNFTEYGKSARQLFEEMMKTGKYIVEERVIQSKVMQCLNPSSVNTIRCMTFVTDKGIKIGPCFLKVGQGGSFVDNGGKGGILIGIDNATGKLNTIGFDEFLNEYPRHPDTGISFLGYQLPEWKKMCSLVKEMAERIPTVRYVGWDMAHTDKGWVVIEGNGSGQMIGPQIVWKHGFKEEIDRFIEG